MRGRNLAKRPCGCDSLQGRTLLGMSTERPPHYDAADPRIYFAAERTLLAWVRTGLAMMGFGFVVARFGLFLRALVASGGTIHVPAAGLSPYVGTSLVALGVVVNLAAAYKHVITLRRLRQGAPVWQNRFSLEVVVAGVLAVIGGAMAAYLLFAA